MTPSSGHTARVGSTCQFTAALRHVETTMVPSPIITDNLAQHLCGASALALALKELQELQVQQGCSKHLRVPARTRILEDWLLEELRSLQPLQHVDGAAAVEVQVVSLGSGLDTRPWRLSFPPGVSVHWICMDFPEVNCQFALFM